MSFTLCTNCANLLPLGGTTCPRCGHSTVSMQPGVDLQAPETAQPLQCAGALHYLPDGASRCGCGKLAVKGE